MSVISLNEKVEFVKNRLESMLDDRNYGVEYIESENWNKRINDLLNKYQLSSGYSDVLSGKYNYVLTGRGVIGDDSVEIRSILFSAREDRLCNTAFKNDIGGIEKQLDKPFSKFLFTIRVREEVFHELIVFVMSTSLVHE